MNAAADAAGAGEAAGSAQSAQNKADNVKYKVQNPDAAASSHVESEVASHTPADPSASTRSKAGAVSAAVDNPEAAGMAEAKSRADVHTPEASVNVHVEGTAGTPPTDPKK
ncbi:MAG TPA: hypothetical protein VLM79_39150 [Kofleriaceae bacterium]|nr:hypothetical protein [Kofleriaceae bacterium]